MLKKESRQLIINYLQYFFSKEYIFFNFKSYLQNPNLTTRFINKLGGVHFMIL